MILVLFYLLFLAILSIVIGYHTERIIANRVFRWISTTSSFDTGAYAVSKKAEMYIKVKRLKQMIADGKGYQEFIDEKKRYEKTEEECIPLSDPLIKEQCTNEVSNSSSNTASAEAVEVKRKLISIGLGNSDPVEVMKKVLKYQQDKIDQQKASLNISLDECAVMEDDVVAIDAETSSANLDEIVLVESDNNEEHPHQVAFLPDSGVNVNKRYFYSELCSLFQKTPLAYHNSKENSQSIILSAATEHDQGSSLTSRLSSMDPTSTILSSSCKSAFSILPMPDIYELNTKRYEQKWINYMRTLDLNSYDVVVAHGSSAEALLRYLESEKIKRSILIDCSDTYTAGERHGRAYRFSLIIDNCKAISIVSTNEKYASESATLSSMLDGKKNIKSSIDNMISEGSFHEENQKEELNVSNLIFNTIHSI